MEAELVFIREIREGEKKRRDMIGLREEQIKEDETSERVSGHRQTPFACINLA